MMQIEPESCCVQQRTGSRLTYICRTDDSPGVLAEICPETKLCVVGKVYFWDLVGLVVVLVRAAALDPSE